MRTPEDILTEHGLWNYTDNIKLTRDRLIGLMQEYAIQFIHPKPCYNCNGSGRVPELTDCRCIACNGTGQLITLPPIQTTFTTPPKF